MKKPPKSNNKAEHGKTAELQPLPEIEKLAKQAEKFRKHIDLTLNSPALKDAQKSIVELEARMRKIADTIMANPNADGWLRLCEILKGAKDDERIKTSAGANDFLELIYFLAADAVTASSADQALEPLAQIFISENARDIANRGHAPNRAYKELVISEWMKHKATGGGNKARFGRLHAKRYKEKFGKEIDDKTISRRWLKDL